MTSKSFFFILVFLSLSMLPYSPNLGATECSRDESQFVDYYIRRFSSKNAWEIAESIKRVAYFEDASTKAIPYLKELVQRNDAICFLALWAILKIDNKNTFSDQFIPEAILKKDSDNIYEVASAAAFLSKTKDFSQSEIDNFLPALYNGVSTTKSTYEKAMIAWALYEIGTELTVQEADKITNEFMLSFFDGSDGLVTGIDAIQVIGPGAKIVIPQLVAIAKEEAGIENIFYSEDAAFTLGIFGTNEADNVLMEFINEILKDFDEKREYPSFGETGFSKALNFILRNDTFPYESLVKSIDKLNDLLPYSLCAQSQIEKVLESEGYPPTVYLEAAKFLLKTNSETRPLARKRLLNIQENMTDKNLRKKATKILQKDY